MVNIVPLGKRLLLKRLEVGEQQTASGLYVAEQGPPPTYKNKILAKGDDVTKPVNIGDVVLTTQFVGDQVKYEQESFYIIDEDDLLTVINQQKEIE